MPQNEHIELHRKRHGRRLDHEERQRKKEAREPRDRAKKAKKLRGLKAKIYNKQRFNEKVRIIHVKKLLKLIYHFAFIRLFCILATFFLTISAIFSEMLPIWPNIALFWNTSYFGQTFNHVILEKKIIRVPKKGNVRPNW